VLGFEPIGSSPIGAEGSDPLVQSFDVEGLIDGQSTIKTISLFELALIRELHKDPALLKSINRRRFEELVAELFSGFGYEVELTQKTRDGGKDIIAIKRKEVNVKYLIECKRPEVGNPVRVKTVRELHGVRDDDGATKAILVTSTYFTPDAIAFAKKNEWVLELRDFDAIKFWLSDYLRLKKES